MVHFCPYGRSFQVFLQSSSISQTPYLYMRQTLNVRCDTFEKSAAEGF